VKYLSVILDSKLLFQVNVENNISKAQKALGVLYCLLKKNNHVPIHSKITLYRSYIRPILTYACPVFANTAKTHMNKLQIFQNKCLRMALNAPYRTRISTLHTRSNIPQVNKFIMKLTENFYEQSAKSENRLVKRLGDYSSRSSLSNMKHKLPRPY
jgi:hypothetical protein